MFVPRQVKVKLSATHGGNESKPDRTASNKTLLGSERPTKRLRLSEEHAELDTEYATEVVKTLEILFSDYSLQNQSREWLHGRFREHDGHKDFVHLTALVEHPLIATLKPASSQKKLSEALGIIHSEILEVSTDKYFVRRRKAIDLSFKSKVEWDHCTAYVEPDVLGLSTIPGRVARVLSDSNPTRVVEHVETGGRAWAFVVFSDVVSDQDATNKADWPKDWIVMTKTEWMRRDALYQRLTEERRFASFHAASIKFSDMVQASRAREQLPSGTLPKRSATTSSQIVDYIPGLILYVSNVHPCAKKANIKSFLTRSVMRYKRNHHDKKVDEGSSEFQIQYVEFKPGSGFTNAHIRVKTTSDGELLVQALKKHKRMMRSPDDARGRKCSPEEKECKQYVLAEVLTGDRERIYWSKLEAAKNRR